MKNLTWKKRQYDDLTIWMAEIKTVGWQFSIEKIKEKQYEAFVYYGHGEDHPIFPQGVYLPCLAEAQRVCNEWLENTILGLNKWI